MTEITTYPGTWRTEQALRLIERATDAGDDVMVALCRRVIWAVTLARKVPVAWLRTMDEFSDVTA